MIEVLKARKIEVDYNVTMISRRKTRKVTIGDEAHGFVAIGGDAPVSVQTMTAGVTHEIDKCVAEILKMAAAGADLGRVAVAGKEGTAALEGGLARGAGAVGAGVGFFFLPAVGANVGGGGEEVAGL